MNQSSDKKWFIAQIKPNSYNSAIQNLERQGFETFLPKMKIELAVSDSEVDNVIEAIRGVANTGKVGDGKIFVYSLDDAVRIRTGEQGEEAL